MSMWAIAAGIAFLFACYLSWRLHYAKRIASLDDIAKRAGPSRMHASGCESHLWGGGLCLPNCETDAAFRERLKELYPTPTDT